MDVVDQKYHQKERMRGALNRLNGDLQLLAKEEGLTYDAMWRRIKELDLIQYRNNLIFKRNMVKRSEFEGVYGVRIGEEWLE